MDRRSEDSQSDAQSGLDFDDALGRATLARRHISCRIDRGERRSAVRVEISADFRQGKPSSGSAEKLNAQFFFKQANAFAYDRGRDFQVFRRCREPLLLSYANESKDAIEILQITDSRGTLECRNLIRDGSNNMSLSGPVREIVGRHRDHGN